MINSERLDWIFLYTASWLTLSLHVGTMRISRGYIYSFQITNSYRQYYKLARIIASTLLNQIYWWYFPDWNKYPETCIRFGKADIHEFKPTGGRWISLGQVKEQWGNVAITIRMEWILMKWLNHYDSMMVYCETMTIYCDTRIIYCDIRLWY